MSDGHGDAGRRALRLLEVAPGPRGVVQAWEALPDALAGLGPAWALAPDGDDAHSAAARAAVSGGEDVTVDPDVALVLATSGSTSDPRGVLLTAGGLLASAHAAHARLSGPGVWTLALPITSVGGIQVLVRSLVTGVAPLVLASVGGAGRFDTAAFADLTDALVDLHGTSRPTYTSLVPTQAALLAVEPRGIDALRSYSAVLLGGARTPPALLDRLRHSGVAAVATYGMTETSGGAVYDGRPLDGVTVSVEDADDHGVGRLVVGGPTVARGYLGLDALSAELFTDAGHRTGDLGRVRDGHVEILGRGDDVVQVGGVNVAVHAVQEVLIEVCTDACVLADPDDTWGHRLTAYVVDGPDDDRLQALVVDRLGRPAVPREWRRLPQLPQLPNGKHDREALRRMPS